MAARDSSQGRSRMRCRSRSSRVEPAAARGGERSDRSDDSQGHLHRRGVYEILARRGGAPGGRAATALPGGSGHRRGPRLRRTSSGNHARMEAMTYAVQKKAISDEAKAKGCVDCGRVAPLKMLDFDHVDPATKLFQVSQAVRKTVSVEAFIAEIAKCEVRCRWCHYRRHALLDPDQVRRGGLAAAGHRRSTRRLTDEQAAFCRASSLTQSALAEIFKVYPSTISHYVRGRRVTVR